jgi:hypothetical protein
MKIINELKKRSESPSDDVKIELKLYSLADSLEKKQHFWLTMLKSFLLTSFSCFNFRPFFMIVLWHHQTGNLMF